MSSFFFITSAVFSQIVFSPNEVNLSGIVLNESGGAVTEATVIIYSAYSRNSQETRCPTCFPDCGKKTVTDEAGKFTLKSVDSHLLFNLVIACEGYVTAKFDRIDPTKDFKVKLKTRDLKRLIPELIIRGKIVDPNDIPIVGAVIQLNAALSSESHWSGGPHLFQDIDPLAVTNQKGEFCICTTKSKWVALNLSVDAIGFAPKRFPCLRFGEKNAATLTMDRGVTISGRVTNKGKIAQILEVTIVDQDTDLLSSLAYYRLTTTNAEGEFSFEHVPFPGKFFLTGTISGAQRTGSIVATRSVTMKKDGKDPPFLDLTTEPTYTVKGVVLLSDMKDIPSASRLVLSRRNALESVSIGLKKDGVFEVSGIPVEEIVLSVHIPGYRLICKPGESPRQRTFFVKDGGMNDLRLVLEPGESPKEGPTNRPVTPTGKDP